MTANRHLMSAIGLGIAVILFLALNLLLGTSLRDARLDLTADRLFTLSDGTRKTLANMQEPVRLRFFFSKDLAKDFAGLRDYATRVRELLEEYVASSNGKVALEVINPEPFTDAEDDAVAFGLQGVQVSGAGDVLYFGLVGTNTTDGQEVIPFFQQERESFLEFDLTHAIYNLANPVKPVIGLISKLPIKGGLSFDPATQTPTTSQPWVVIQQIQQLFEVRELSVDVKDIAAEIGLLMVVHPKELATDTLYAIDQFVLRGGKAMVFVDPFSESAASIPDPQNPMNLHNSRMPELFDAWGVDLAPAKIVGDRLAARKVSIGGAERPQAIDYLPWLDLDSSHFNRDDVITAELGRVTMATAGVLSQKQGASTNFEPLIWSSDQAMQIDRHMVQFRPDPAAILDGFVPTGERYVMAARVSGAVKSAFPDGPPSAKKADEPAAPDSAADTAADDADDETPAPAAPTAHLSESKAPINLIVVADSDILADRFWVSVQDFLGQGFAVPVANNGAFVVNALEVLGGGDELIGLRSRGVSQRPFTVVADLQREAEDRFRQTEKALQAKLQDTEQKLAELQTSEVGGAPVLTPEQQTTVLEFREQLVATRKQLRDVQHSLNQDIETLGVWLKLINIGVVPSVIGILAVALFIVRRMRRQRAMSAS